MSLVRNERLKLLANFLNAIAAGCVTTGVIAQTFALAFNSSGERTLIVTLLCLIWLLFGLVLHLIAQAILGGLKR